MSIKTIVCPFGGETQELNALTSALALARSGHAVLRVVHIAMPPFLPVADGIGMYASAAYGDGKIIDVLEADEEERSKTAEAVTRENCERFAVPLRSEEEPVVMGQTQAYFRVAEGEVRVEIQRHALTADLIVAGYDNRPEGDLEGLMAGLFDASKPVLAIPRNPAVSFAPTGFARTVVVAWDGSRASARALREAVPHLIHAREVFVVRICEGGSTSDLEDEFDVRSYLASHCVGAEFVNTERGHHAVGEVILAQAKNLGADLLVMGAYGHSHVGEMLWGGATDYVVKHTQIPLLLAH